MKVYDIATKIEYKKIKTLTPNSKTILSFLEFLSPRYNYKVGIVGQVDVPENRRFEDVYSIYYRKLDDSLKLIDGSYALSFDEENQVHERSCYLMLKNDFKKGVQYEFGIKYKATDVDANFKVSLEAYYGKKNTRYYYETPDKVLEFDLTGSENFTTLTQTIEFDREVSFVMLKIFAIDYTGNAVVFAPFLTENGVDVALPFFPSKDFEDFQWIGEGFSLIERPKFKVTVNGVEIFNGRKVETCDCFSGVEFAIPDGVLKRRDNVIEVHYPAENVADYQIKSARLIAMPKRFEVLGYDKIVPANKPFGVLVHSDDGVMPNVEVLDSSVKFIGVTDYKSGENVLKFMPSRKAKNVKILIMSGTQVKLVTIDSIVEKNDDGVITGTGDAIYLPQDYDDFIEYLSWYLTNGIGKLLTFRSNYRWGRNAECNESFWKKAVPLLCDLNIYYSLMLEGRELNGANGSPGAELLQSDYFLGEQTHEMDGSYIYWGQDIPNAQTETFYHSLSRKIERPGIYGKRSPVYDKRGVPKMFYATDGAKDMKEAYENFAENVKHTQEKGATRHTGVTPFFHTFFDSGYKWIGYESMYGPHELIYGAARGMSRSVGQNSFGAHAALQWSTMPLETKGHLLRYKISLNLSYMHGVTEINTEEGLWRFSNSYSKYDRFSKPCKDHLKVQREFNKFVAKNERKGKIKPNIAMIVGKYDGNDLFSASQVFGQEGKYWAKSSPEHSWDLLKTFYPRADLNAIYYYIVNGGRRKINAKDKAIMRLLPGLYRDVIDEEPVGFYSETPYGAIDIISADCENYSDYKFLFFTGWNTTSETQLKKLCAFVENGGTLLIARAHLSDETDRKTVLDGNAEIIKSNYVDKLLSYRDSGRVMYFDNNYFPSEYAEEYSAVLRENAEKFGGQYVRNVNRVSYVEYDVNGKKVLYLQNIGWWTKTPASCEVKIKDKWQKVKIYGYDIKIVEL